MRWPWDKPTDEFFDGSLDLPSAAADFIHTIKQNHALEHATINLLMPRLKRKVRLIGHAGFNGFYIYGNIPTDILEASAREALSRLQDGEKDLAVSPMCGTNLVVTGLAAGIASMIASRGRSGFNKFSHVVQASIMATVIAQPLGRLAQKHVTTTPDLENVSIVRVVKIGEGNRIRHKVELTRS